MAEAAAPSAKPQPESKPKTKEEQEPKTRPAPKAEPKPETKAEPVPVKKPLTPPGTSFFTCTFGNESVFFSYFTFDILT